MRMRKGADDVARFNLYVPDELAARVRSELPGLNLSAALQSTVEDLLQCTHRRGWRCLDCGSVIERSHVMRDEMTALYHAVIARVEPLVFRGATAQGACDVMQDVFAERGGVKWHARIRPARSPAKRIDRWNQRQAKETA